MNLVIPSLPRRASVLPIALVLVLVASLVAQAEISQYPGGPVVAGLVGRLLEQMHYAHKRIDASVSRQFLMNYLESYDYDHMILDKSDVDEFETKYAATLGELAKNGDVAPAYEIYNRIEQRLEQRVALVKKLAASTFTFTADERIEVDRHEAPWPTKEEVPTLWRLRIKHEALLERLARLKASASAKGAKPAKESSIEETIDARYDRLLHSYNEYDGTDVLQDYLSSLTHVFDPHTDYLAESSKEVFDISMKLSLVGIGAVLHTDDGYAKIVSLLPGGPAATGKKLKPNDRVEAVAQGDGPFIEVVGMRIDKVVDMIRGEKGTIVRLRVIPADALDPSTRVVVSIVRDEVKLTEQEAKARVYTLPAHKKGERPIKIGVLDIPTFYADMQGGENAKSLTRDAERLLAELKRRGVDAVVVDVRHDPGGSLAEAVSLTGLFMKEGPVLQVKDARGAIHVLNDVDGAQVYNGPLVVLTSRGSASAAEIFAAAMQDYGRAVIVGDKSTFGKGTVQSVLELGDYLPPAFRSYQPGALKLTVQKFYRVSGGSTQNRGVIPDIHLPSPGDLSDMTESAQKNALPYDEIRPAHYDRVNSVDAAIASLEKASGVRVAASKEFQWIREDLARWETLKKEKSVSLNENKRLAEKKADESRTEGRKKERAALKQPPLPFDEITLEALDGKSVEPTSSTNTAVATAPDNDEEYERAPDAPDAVLNETLAIASDLATASVPAATAGGSKIAKGLGPIR